MPSIRTIKSMLRRASTTNHAQLTIILASPPCPITWGSTSLLSLLKSRRWQETLRHLTWRWSPKPRRHLLRVPRLGCKSGRMEILRSSISSCGRRWSLRKARRWWRKRSINTLLLLLASANHDPGRFPDPERFDPYRANARGHIAFGMGIHYCLGAALARLQVAIVLELLAARFPHLRLREAQRYTFAPNISFRGPTALWLVLGGA